MLNKVLIILIISLKIALFDLDKVNRLCVALSTVPSEANQERLRSPGKDKVAFFSVLSYIYLHMTICLDKLMSSLSLEFHFSRTSTNKISVQLALNI